MLEAAEAERTPGQNRPGLCCRRKKILGQTIDFGYKNIYKHIDISALNAKSYTESLFCKKKKIYCPYMVCGSTPAPPTDFKGWMDEGEFIEYCFFLFFCQVQLKLKTR